MKQDKCDKKSEDHTKYVKKKEIRRFASKHVSKKVQWFFNISFVLFMGAGRGVQGGALAPPWPWPMN